MEEQQDHANVLNAAELGTQGTVKTACHAYFITVLKFLSKIK